MFEPTCKVCAGPLPPRHRSFCGADCKAASEKARSRARYLADIDGYKQQSKQWKLDNPDRAKELARDYAMRHRDQTRDREAAYRLQNRQRYSRHVREWYWRDPEHGRMLGAWPMSPLWITSDCSTRYDGECAYCHVQLGDSFDWDHVVPVSRGGRHSVGNLVPACQTCNRSKGAKLLVEWRRGLTVL